MSYTIEAMRGLSLGGPVRTPLLAVLLWSVSIAVVCAIPMAIGYRKASMRG
jgi:ABC-2 type transport system permease protein